MTKKDMVRLIAEDMDLTQVQVKEVIQRVFDGIGQTLVTEGRIELRNFGIFEVRKRRPRTARNPRTGELVDVPERLVVTFKAGREMQQRVDRRGTVPSGSAAAATPPGERSQRSVVSALVNR
jgi:nucleoid DNA-binding protein